MPYNIKRIGFAPASHPLNVAVRACFKRAGFQRIRLWLNKDVSMLSFRFELGKHPPFNSRQEARAELRRLLAEVGIEPCQTEPFVDEFQGDQVNGAFCPPDATGQGVAGLVGTAETYAKTTVTNQKRRRSKRRAPPRVLTAEEAEAVRRLCDRAWAATKASEIELLGPEMLRIGELADPGLNREVNVAFLALLTPEPELDVSRPHEVAEWCGYLLTQPRERARVLAMPAHRVRDGLTGEAVPAYAQLLKVLERT
jgi:hypothetical protein